MGLTVRYYLFPSSGNPLRLPKELVTRLSRTEDFLPEYANTKQRVLEIVIENVDGKPDSVVDARGSYWDFDERGGIAEGLQKSLAAALETWWGVKADNGAKVVDIRPKIKRRRYEAEHLWEATKAEIALVSDDLINGGRAAGIKVASGTIPKPPAITRDAKRALAAMTEPFYQIQNAIEDLKEPALAGLAFEARRMSGEFDQPQLYRAVAEIADQRAEILRRRRRGGGTWYAFVEIMNWRSDDYIGRIGTTTDVYHVKCNGKKSAVAAARNLLARYSDRFAEDTTVEAFIETDLEWDATGRLSSEAE